MPESSSDQIVKQHYLDEYAQLYDHVGMLRDHERMRSYHDAIKLNSKAHFEGKVVLDVGTGTGVLAIWAAQAGAKRVYAVEASGIGKLTTALINAHGFDEVVTLLRGRVEDQQLPEQVDVIVSEWMGYFLLRESMVSSVLFARDRWLKPGGVMYPSHSRLMLAPLHSPSFMKKREEDVLRSMEEWDGMAAELESRYSLKMGALRSAMHAEHFAYSFRQAWQGPVPAAAMPAKPEEAAVLLELDMRTCTEKDIFGWRRSVQLRPLGGVRAVEALCGWFDVRFCAHGDVEADTCVELDTSPFVEGTHWGQTVFALSPPLISDEATIYLTQSARDHHNLNVTIEYNGDVATSYAVTADFTGFDGDESDDGASAYDDDWQ